MHRNTMKVRPFSSQGEAKALVHALVSRIDYCNARLRLNPLQPVLNAAAEILTTTQKREHHGLFRRTSLISSYASLLLTDSYHGIDWKDFSICFMDIRMNTFLNKCPTLQVKDTCSIQSQWGNNEEDRYSYSKTTEEIMMNVWKLVPFPSVLQLLLFRSFWRISTLETSDSRLFWTRSDMSTNGVSLRRDYLFDWPMVDGRQRRNMGVFTRMNCNLWIKLWSPAGLLLSTKIINHYYLK